MVEGGGVVMGGMSQSVICDFGCVFSKKFLFYFGGLRYLQSMYEYEEIVRSLKFQL